MDYQIRPALPRDQPTLVQFNAHLALETEGKHLDVDILSAGIAGLFAQEHRGFYTVVEQAGQVVACALITYEWSDWRNSPIWWLQSVYVDTAHRRQGLFRLLYNHLKIQAQHQGVFVLRLYVDHDNEHAKSTYQALGMQPSNYDLYEAYLG